MKHDLPSPVSSKSRPRARARAIGMRPVHLAAWVVLLTLSAEGRSSSTVKATAVPDGIRWKSGAVDPAGTAPAGTTIARQDDLAERIARLAGSPERHLVVQLDRPVTSSIRASLAGRGLTLLQPLGEHAFFASLAPRDVNGAALAAVPELLRVEAVQVEHKIHPQFQSGATPEYAVVGTTAQGSPQVAAYVVFHPDVPLEPEARAVMARYGTVRDSVSLVNAFVVELPRENLLALALEDAVQWIEPPLPRMSDSNDSNRPRIEADTAQGPPYDLTGSGVTVLVYDGGRARATHQDFGGRLAVKDTSPLSSHATHVSGTIGGSGAASGGLRKGMAPGVTMLSYGFQWDNTGIFLYTNPGDIQADYSQAINTYGAHIANNSISTNTELNNFPCNIQGDYGVTDQLLDNIVRGSLGTPFRIIWANGNERSGSDCDIEGYGDYYSMSPPATAKNHITVGALNSNNDTMTSFSSWGPTDDGRMKPDISSAGCQSGGDGGVTSCSASSDTSYSTLCGTSMASPTVCGASALLMQDYRALYPGPDMRNSTLKILLAHTAVDLGNAGPDYQFGYGSVRIVSAIDFMRLGDFAESSVDQGAVDTYVVNVLPGTPQLKVMLAWDDPAGTPNVIPSLINDLDLVVYDPSGTRAFPWTLAPLNPSAPAVRTVRNSLDNIEQVVADNPVEGMWIVQVTGFNVPQGPQPFSVCASPNLVDALDVPSQHATIQAAADAASSGQIVALANGTYQGAGNRDVVVTGKSITFLGSDPQACTMDCQDLGPGFRLSSTPGAGITVQGIRIVNGKAIVPLGDFGGGIDSVDGSLTLRNCIIEDCESGAQGAGIFFDMNGSADQSLDIANSVIRNNRTTSTSNGLGGGLYVDGGNAPGGRVSLRNCIVSGNTTLAGGAGIYCFFAPSSPTDNDLEIQGCTISMNSCTSPSGQGGGLVTAHNSNSTGLTTIRNSILWRNAAATGAPLTVGDGTCSVEYCDLQGGQFNVEVAVGATLLWGTGNLAVDPQFVDPASDFHLRKFSPCINKGDPAYVVVPGEQDIDGGVRILQDRIEMGADERPSALQPGGP